MTKAPLKLQLRKFPKLSLNLYICDKYELSAIIMSKLEPEKEAGKKIAGELFSALNWVGVEEELTNDFIEIAETEHPSLQAKFSKLCRQWDEKKAEDFEQGNFDARDAFQVAKSFAAKSLTDVVESNEIGKIEEKEDLISKKIGKIITMAQQLKEPTTKGKRQITQELIDAIEYLELNNDLEDIHKFIAKISDINRKFKYGIKTAK
jgi:hypothetical protein